MRLGITTERALSSFNKIIERTKYSTPEISKISECNDDEFLNIDKKDTTQILDVDPHEDKPNHKFYKLIRKSRENSSGTNLDRS